MKRIFLLLVLVILYQSCYRTDDDTKTVCTSNCTILKGRFVTKNSTPLKNIKLRLDYRISSAPFGANTRIIKETQTDENGFYNMEFYIEDSEIGENGLGFFALLIDQSSLNPENYIRRDEIYSLPTRDTIIDKSFYIPTKEFITVNLNNFLPIEENDRFEVQTLFPSGLHIGQNDLIDSEYSSQSSEFDKYTSSNQFETFNDVIVAINEMNLIRIVRVKKGVGSTEDFLIFIPENNNVELTYEY